MENIKDLFYIIDFINRKSSINYMFISAAALVIMVIIICVISYCFKTELNDIKYELASFKTLLNHQNEHYTDQPQQKVYYPY